jgi:hypothetical protein
LDTSAQRHPAEDGLLGSGYVVSVVRSATDIQMEIVGDGHFVGVTLPGNPCGVVVCCSAEGVKALVTSLADGFDLLRASLKTARDQLAEQSE